MLHIICNADVMTPPEGRTEDGFETQFGTNHLAHFLLFNLLQPALLAGATPELASRVVILSSVGHRFGEVPFDNINFDGNYDAVAAYALSKTANLWTANEIERRYGDPHWWVNGRKAETEGARLADRPVSLKPKIAPLFMFSAPLAYRSSTTLTRLPTYQSTAHHAPQSASSPDIHNHIVSLILGLIHNRLCESSSRYSTSTNPHSD